MLVTIKASVKAMGIYAVLMYCRWLSSLGTFKEELTAVSEEVVRTKNLSSF